MAEENVNVSQGIPDTQTESQPAPASTEKKEPEISENFKKIIQSEVDRATHKLGNENKALRKQLEDMQKEKLSEDELKALELSNKEKDIADREAKLREKENRLFAIKAIKDAGLDDGGNNALELVDLVMGEDETTIKNKVKVFSELVKKFVAAQVDQTFKSKGRDPEKGGTSESNSTNNIAASIGKATADRNEKSNKVINYYLGGK